MNALSEKEFMKWAESLKPCRYCCRRFIGPVCPWCELILWRPRK